ncbi:MAG: hypothetical protein ACREQN_14725 [Candidatus Binataceae bacterium]
MKRLTDIGRNAQWSFIRGQSDAYCGLALKAVDAIPFAASDIQNHKLEHDSLSALSARVLYTGAAYSYPRADDR